MQKLITISEDGFKEIAAKVMRDDKTIDAAVSVNPMCLLVIATYAARLTSYLFNKKEDK